jgi:hypothetical protein
MFERFGGGMRSRPANDVYMGSMQTRLIHDCQVDEWRRGTERRGRRAREYQLTPQQKQSFDERNALLNGTTDLAETAERKEIAWRKQKLKRFLDSCLERGQLEIVAKCKRWNATTINEAMAAAAVAEDRNAFQQLHDQGIIIEAPVIAAAAAAVGSTVILDMCIEFGAFHHHYGWCPSFVLDHWHVAMTAAGSAGNLARLQYCYDRGGGGSSDLIAAMVGAAANNHIECMRFCHEQTGGLLSCAINAACSAGNIDAVQWCIDLGASFIRSEAILDTFKNGRLNIIKLLVSERVDALFVIEVCAHEYGYTGIEKFCKWAKNEQRRLSDETKSTMRPLYSMDGWSVYETCKKTSLWVLADRARRKGRLKVAENYRQTAKELGERRPEKKKKKRGRKRRTH